MTRPVTRERHTAHMSRPRWSQSRSPVALPGPSRWALSGSSQRRNSVPIRCEHDLSLAAGQGLKVARSGKSASARRPCPGRAGLRDCERDLRRARRCACSGSEQVPGRRHRSTPIDTDRAGRLIGEICRGVDGLPLAIELAAARVAGLDLEDISLPLDDLFDLLPQPARRTDGAQRSLRATVEWSDALLTGEERHLLRRMAVFAGGFDLAAIKEVILVIMQAHTGSNEACPRRYPALPAHESLQYPACGSACRPVRRTGPGDSR